MSIFKKLRKSEKDSKAAKVPSPEPSLKQLDSRIGLASYRDFYSLKNYWKAIDRKRSDASFLFFSSIFNHKYNMGAGASSDKPSQLDNPKQQPSSDEGGLQKVDSRLPFSQFRELYTLKNYWKVIRRTEKESGKSMFAKYLKQSPENVKLYPKLKNVDISKITPDTADAGFETMAANYLKVFDDVITAVEETPADCSDACSRLIAVGKIHRAKVSGMSATQFQDMEKPFIETVSEILQDRFNEKVENLFRKFFQFCLKYLSEGLNS